MMLSLTQSAQIISTSSSSMVTSAKRLVIEDILMRVNTASLDALQASKKPRPVTNVLLKDTMEVTSSDSSIHSTKNSVPGCTSESLSLNQ